MVFVAKKLEDYKGRNFGFILYPDTESYDVKEVLLDIRGYFNEWSFIVHDRDINEETGEIKKSHIHVVCYKGSSVNGITVINRYSRLGVPVEHMYAISSYRAQIRYLLHLDHPEKVQYREEEVYSSVVDIRKYFDKPPEGFIVLNMAEERCRGATYKDLVTRASIDGTYDIFRRNLGIIKLLVQEDFEIRMSKLDFSGYDPMDGDF